MSIGDVIRCVIEPGGTRNRPVLYSTEMVLVEIVGRPAGLVRWRLCLPSPSTCLRLRHQGKDGSLVVAIRVREVEVIKAPANAFTFWERAKWLNL
jgi:hypothetical protein